MQDFIKQANKKGITLYTKGRCQFCGACVEGGVFECMDIYNDKILYFDYNLSEINQTRFLIVDAHALQHPELHGRWNNHFHLIRLNLILNKKIKWNYSLSPLLSDYLKSYKKVKQSEILIAPPESERGKISAKEVSLAIATDKYTEIIYVWANEVYAAWRQHHELASEIGENFLKTLND